MPGVSPAFLPWWPTALPGLEPRTALFPSPSAVSQSVLVSHSHPLLGLLPGDSYLL